ncbi:MAG: nitroreductase family protein [Acidimicrobiales bacterium]|jgi:nitroreductase
MVDITSDLDIERINGLNEIIRGRRSVRSFESGGSVDRSVLLNISDAGRWAPSGANSQPWEICIAESPEAVAKTAKVLADQADRLNEHCRGFPHVHKKHWVHDAVAIFVVFVDTRWSEAYPVATDPAIDRTEYAKNRENILLVSVGAAVQNIQLATSAVGLTSAWLSGGGEPQTAHDLQQALNFPATHIPYAAVPIGWPHRRSESRWRRDLEAVTHWNGADPALLRDQSQIDNYIATERRDSIYRDAEARDALVHGRGVEQDEIDPVDDGTGT